MKLSLAIIGVCVLCLVKTVQTTEDPAPACQFWNKLAYNLSHASEQNGGVLQFACNHTCNSVSCRGHFKAPPVFSLHFEEDLCFGLRLNQCSSPLALDYYIIVPNSGVTNSGSISHNDSFDLPGPEVYGIKSTIVVIVEMVRVNATAIKFGVNTNVRASLGGLPGFEDKEKVLPEMYIIVPPCTSGSKAVGPFETPSSCAPLPNISTQKPATTRKGVTTVKPVKRTYKSCELGVGNCKKNEMCKVISENPLSRNGICVCQPGVGYDAATGACRAQSTISPDKSTVTKPSAHPSVTVAQTTKSKKGGINTNTTVMKPSARPSVTVAQTTKSKSGGINMTAVIIGAVFGGLLLIVVVVSIIVFLGRRRRQANYRGRHQLLSDNDDDDDTNVVI
ncbi:uncharacterized protein LOC132726568 isoform X2 [Ruditapes philippinarum]|uniref:uncharacterized protein LOC132726568 isoform X2 n=1 Tax=Ruditapes philippinarum TaxID=129788 RepID=UPI00295BA3F8|nr:uncharacterized protein LOC132726568 isoform X2 [Ruditapes philippinarum]